MESIQEPLISLSLHGLIHEHRENIDIGMYYYVAVYDYTDDGVVNDCEYIGHIVSIDADELVVEMIWRRQLIEGNEQQWSQIESENMTFSWLDIDAPHERPCIRFYRTVRQS